MESAWYDLLIVTHNFFCYYSLLPAWVQLLETFLEAFREDYFHCSYLTFIILKYTVETASHINTLTGHIVFSPYNFWNMCNVSVGNFSKYWQNFHICTLFFKYHFSFRQAQMATIHWQLSRNALHSRFFTISYTTYASTPW